MHQIMVETATKTTSPSATVTMDPDPRVQVELENLNTSTEFINKLELELEKARTEFNNLLTESSMKIESLSKKLGTSINKSRPYYEACAKANELHRKAQKEALRYEQATAEHNNAKEIVHLAEQTLKSQQSDGDDTDFEQLLTKSAEKVNQAEMERVAAEKQHLITSREYCLTEQKLSKLHNQLKRSIVKASMETRRNFLELNNYANQHRLQLLPYFEMKAQFNQMLEEQANKIRSYEARVNKAKKNYTKALKRLEELNQKIYLNSNQDDSSNKISSLIDLNLVLPDSSDAPTKSSPQNSLPSPAFSSNSLDEEKIKTSLSSMSGEDDYHPLPLPKQTITKREDSSLSSKSCSSNQNSLGDETIFDNATLDQLVLEDELDMNIDRLKMECLTNKNEKAEQETNNSKLN